MTVTKDLSPGVSVKTQIQTGAEGNLPSSICSLSTVIQFYFSCPNLCQGKPDSIHI